MKRLSSLFLALPVFLIATLATASAADKQEPMSAKTFKGLELRNIGPALMSGRIADIAIDPDHSNVWYVGVGSGGVWKTENNGTTWKPLFDDQSAYSIGEVTLDPGNSKRIWVGTGENVGGRHMGYGDGVYLSNDGGAHWKNMGLKESEHISRIVVSPEDPDTVWVAAQGPLWSAGGQRGVYKTSDGGKTWKQVLAKGEWTGATDLLIDPRDPDRLYAALWQHERSTAAYMGGGPESGIYRSDDGGETWTQLTEGLPEGNMGKIGLGISPQRPDVLYAAIETDRRKGGFYRSDDRGASWEKRSDFVGGGTGPHYYQEVWPSPNQFDKIYVADVRMKVSTDGGKTFQDVPHKHKHSDNHALAFRQGDDGYLLAGCDGGLYESYDDGDTWRFIDNLPITQFYKISVDDSKPFYYVYGGTQDNNSQGGPSRTDNVNGIRNADWFITLFADGYDSATEPGNPDIMYSEWQNGNLVRVDRTTGQKVHIQPQPKPGDPPVRFNWDAPIQVSHYSPARLYFASQRVWRSDDRGDSWTAISGDLTRNENRMHLKLMGRQWGWNAPWDMFAMSNYNTITSLAESPVKEGLLYAGTDDGLIQVTEDGGDHWHKIDVGDLSGVPDRAFVNDIRADLFDADTVYVALDAHKLGDFHPYLFKSTDRGRSWENIGKSLPDRHLVWRLVQDDVDKNLLFAATEFGIFFTVDGGGQWVKLEGGVPNIPFRDIKIQRREDDLVGGSFGRGIYILDNYAPLRDVSAKTLGQAGALFPIRDPWWYIPQQPLGGKGQSDQGDGYFVAPNPPFGALITYYLKDDLKSAKEQREEQDKKARESGKDNPTPDWKVLAKESREPEPAVILTIYDEQGNPIRRIEGPAKAGMHRVNWDLKYPSTVAIGKPAQYPDEEGSEPTGFLAPPGEYSVTLSSRVDGQIHELAGPVKFTVKQMREGALKGAPTDQVVAFWQDVAMLNRSVSAASQAIGNARDRIKAMHTAVARSRTTPDGLDKDLYAMEQDLYDIEEGLSGSQVKGEVGEPAKASVSTRLAAAAIGTRFSTYGPTPTHEQSLEWGKQAFQDLRTRLNAILTERIPAVEQKLADSGAPWTPGAPIPPVK